MGIYERARPVEETATIAANKQLAAGIYMVELEAPEIASRARPGQFVHMQVPGMEGHILRRPFSLCGWGDGRVRIMYQVVGYGTGRLAELESGTEASLMGPIGRGWNPPEGTRHAVLVCGGMGAAPQMMLAGQLARMGARVDCLLGATSAERLVGVDELRSQGAFVYISTDDGSVGYHGFCTDLIAENARDADYISVCGPEPMEKAAVRAIHALGPSESRTCEVSLERRMACGIGACLSCVVDTVSGRKRACVDGPVFEVGEVVWR